jgi:hypothetical protein
MNPSMVFIGKIWLWPGGTAAWHFITVPKKFAPRILKRYTASHPLKKRGWGSVPVEVAIGKVTWQTSVFPEKKSGTYLLPVKASVRKAGGLYYDQTVKVRLRVL